MINFMFKADTKKQEFKTQKLKIKAKHKPKQTIVLFCQNYFESKNIFDNEEH